MTTKIYTDDVSNLPDRIKRIREEFFNIMPSISVARSIATTEVFKNYPSLPLVLRRAKAFYRACETIPIYIGKDELIIGHPGGKPRAGVFSPEIAYKWLENELETVHKRPQDPYYLAEEDKKILKEEIFPFWKGKSVEEFINTELAEIDILPLTVKSGIIDCEVKSTSGGGDLSPGIFNILFVKGFEGVKETARASMKKFAPTNAKDIKKIYFLKSVLTVCDAMILLGKRYEDIARELASKENDPTRKKELEKIAETCAHIPAKPPRTLQEALQCAWFAIVALFLEENTSGSSPGRVDEYLYPFYKRDIESGLLTPEQAEELIYCFLIKFNEIPWLLSEFATHYFAGYIPFLNIVVGGVNRMGRDSTNELSYVFMNCVKNLKMYQPSFSARVHNTSPQKFLLKIAETIAVGLGFPAIHFDDTTIKMLISQGISLEDARDYCIMGCVEPSIHGKLSRWSSACYTNFPIAIEMALFNGVHLQSKERLGLETGEAENFKTFEEFEDAVKKQLNNIIRVAAIATIIAQTAHKIYLPKTVSSIMLEGCVESGKDIMSGGAKYNSGPGVIFVGTADYANSMAAIKKLVFDDKTVSMKQLCEALKNDFNGYDEIKNACIKAPKYGNDDDYVDLFATDIIDYSASELNRHKGLYSNLQLGTLSVTTNVAQGLVIGAQPSGRKAGEPLADGISPYRGTDVKGPTAAMKSVNKINQEASSVGTLYNMKLDPALLGDEKGFANFTALLRTQNQLGGAQIQFNCISSEKLLDAQKNPDKYRSLIVRVSGYSAFFTELCKEVQDDIIARSTQTKWS